MDQLRARSVPVFGCTAAAAELEGSKIFAKRLMQRHGIPTAAFGAFDELAAASAFVDEQASRGVARLVVKADGLAAGKGVVICESAAEARRTVGELMGGSLGSAGARVVIEEFLVGREASLMALCAGETVVPLAPAEDHKRVFDGDEGPMTGGMGVICPTPVLTAADIAHALEQVLRPTARALAAEGRPFTGVLYAGLMMTAAGPRVLEFNCRFGDPEAETLLMRLDGVDDVGTLLHNAARGVLPTEIRFSPRAATCVVLTAAGYPGPPRRGDVIGGLEEAEALGDVKVFHGATAFVDGRFQTAGGRVLAVTALGADVDAARALAYRAAGTIHFAGAHYRRDIGARAARNQKRGTEKVPMAEIAPFAGIVYDAHDAGDVVRLLAPPYDVFTDAERESLAAADPHNFVRLILPKDHLDEDSDEKYEIAGERLIAWQAQGVLKRDAHPALYRYAQTFTPPDGGDTVTRRGFIARVKLERFGEGSILPHERTLAGPKADRLKLMRATRAHLSQVFGMFPDPERRVEHAFAHLDEQAPFLDATTPDKVRQRLWRLTDPDKIAAIATVLRDAKVYIADGHHRYETMLALRDELSAGHEVSPRSSVNYGSIFLCSIDDPGLLVFPTHRVIHGLATFDRAALLGGARAFFTVDETAVVAAEEVRAELARRGQAGPSFAVATGNQLAYLTLRNDVDLGEMGGNGAALTGATSRLDVTLLHALVIEKLLHIDRAAQEKQTNLRYLKDTRAALAAAHDADVQAVLLMNPTPVADVRRVADAGEVMPQKSTFFYPKLASGVVVNPFSVEEEI